MEVNNKDHLSNMNTKYIKKTFMNLAVKVNR